MRSRYISLLLALLMLATTAIFPLHTSAAVDLSTQNLTTGQKYFLRTIGSLARADYYQTDILASVTLAQGIYESGWGRHSLPVGGHNLFGIKAFNTWEGMVYDQTTSMLYASYDDFLTSAGVSHVNTVSAWRAHENWAESVSVHSRLFYEESKYAAVIGEKDYKKCAQAIVNAGYCSDSGYVNMICNLITQYGLAEYDNLTPDEDGIVALTTTPERKWLEIGESYTVPLAFYPADKTPSSITWKSDKPEVATVDKNGKVTAVAHGTTLITATLANGREAACIVYVDCNATVIDSNVAVYSAASKTSTNNGWINQGEAIKVTDSKVYTDVEGNQFYKVSGYKSNGTMVSGYALTKYIYLNKRNVSIISVIKDNVTVKVGDKYTVRTVVAPADAVDVKLTWTSSNQAVATVDQNGVITAKSLGSAVITAKAVGGMERKINLTVASEYPQYSALISAYEELTIRSQPSSTGSRLGVLRYLTEVTVIGDAEGAWYNVKGVDANGKTIEGYASSSYVYVLDKNYTVTYGEVSEDITVYSEANTSSTSYGKLLSGSKYAVVKDAENGWKYIIGVKTNKNSVRGYAKIGDDSTLNSGAESDTSSTPEKEEIGYRARTTAELNVRSGAGGSYSSVGVFPLGAEIVISGEAVDGWYKVSGTSKDGSSISGYSSSKYITVLYSGTVKATQLNVRNAPVSGAVVGQFNNGDSIIIVGEADNGWYLVESTDGTLKGYCSADYVTNNGKIPVGGGNGETEEKFAITDSKLKITNNILYGVSLNTKTSDLLRCFKGTVSVVSPSGTELKGTELVGTGCKIKVTENGKTYYAATVLIKGDVDSDGTVAVQDYVLVKRYFLGTYPLEGVYYQAGCLSGKDALDVTDYVLIKRACLGNYLIK